MTLAVFAMENMIVVDLITFVAVTKELVCLLIALSFFYGTGEYSVSRTEFDALVPS